MGSEALVAPNLFDGDEVRILGARRGITYGRWTGGPADTLSIEFDLSHAGPAMRDDPEFRAMLDRAGKVWSRRIADTWSTWERPGGTFKGWRLSNGDNPSIRSRSRKAVRSAPDLRSLSRMWTLPELSLAGQREIRQRPALPGNLALVRSRSTGSIFRTAMPRCSRPSPTRSGMCWGHGGVVH